MRQGYGDYTADIIEGRQDDETSLGQESDIEQVHENTILLQKILCYYVRPIVEKLVVFNDNIINISISGNTPNKINDLISKAKATNFWLNKCMDNIVVCLGTHDVTDQYLFAKKN